MNLCVWAPLARSVDLVLADEKLALAAAQDGEWQIDIAEEKLRQGYRYSVDGGAPMPDPRSRWQPDGVHGASHQPFLPALDDAGFHAPPLHDAVIYELHAGTFTPEGTYVAAAMKLGHLKRLGVTHIELLPIATFPGGHGWGYDGVDLFAPHPAYGSPQELAAFVRECHTQGLAVLLDVVYNHLGPDGNYLGEYAPYFTDHYKTGWGSAVNYDAAHSDGVRRFVIDNALMWLRDYGFDGLRLDAVHAIFSFEAVHVLEELAAAVKQLQGQIGRPLVLIAESDLNDPKLVRPVDQGGYGLDAHWEDDFHHALHRFFTGEVSGYYADFHGLADVATALRDGYVYQGQYSAFRKRRHGRPPQGVAPGQIVVCAQNHDQIGNRANGERLSMLLKLPQLQAIAAMTLLTRFVPMLFQGEEWGARSPFLYFTDHQDAELGRLVAEGRAREFSSFAWQGEVPNPQLIDTFNRSKLDWSEILQPEHRGLLEWHRQLIALRASTAQGAGRPLEAKVCFDERAGWLSHAHAGLLALFNFNDAEQRVPLPEGRWTQVLSSVDCAAPQGELPGASTVIYRQMQ